MRAANKSSIPSPSPLIFGDKMSHAIAWVKPVYPHAHLPVLTDMDVPSTTLMQCLYQALSLRRASGSQTEAKFVAWLCNRLPVSMVDEAGNIHVDMRKGTLGATMFTSHTDTVHREGGVNTLRVDRSSPGKVLWRADEGACLGADDGAGVALMMHMIIEGVPGYYVFFRGEECGGVGSRWLAHNMPEMLAEFDACVSFDRAGYTDVITHQGCGRCCSDKYAMALAVALTTDDMTLAFTPDDTGVFTDSANLVDYIPECTNLSVGYKHQHGDGEWQDITFLASLAERLCLVPWDDLPIERDPKKPDVRETAYTPWWREGFGSAALSAAPSPYETSALADALDDAIEGKFYALRGVVAAHLLPDDPEMAIKHVDPNRLTTQEYLYYGDMLYEGTREYEVLDELVHYLYVER